MNSIHLWRRSAHVFALVVVGLVANYAASAQQAPALLWRTNVNARVFAVDDQTNVYANTNGTVIVLNSSGVPVQTNVICPVGSIAAEFAQRDSAGNFYFAGNFDGTNDFKGTILVGGWINGINYHPARWQPGWPTCFLAKYAANGSLLWATNFGVQAASNVVSDLVLNSDGSLTVALNQGAIGSQIAQYSSSGSFLWQTELPGGSMSFGPAKISAVLGTNGIFVEYQSGQLIDQGYFTTSGTAAFNAGNPLLYSSALAINGEPVRTGENEFYLAGLSTPPSSQPVLEKVSIGGGIVWTQAIGSVEQWVLNSDAGGNLYLAGTSGSFSKYDSNGVQIWTTNYGSPAIAGVVDSSNNRFVQFSDDTIARIDRDAAPVGPFIKPPASTTAFLGDSVILNVAAAGTPPFSYAWQFNGTNLPGATGPSLSFSSVAFSNAGSYTVVVSNPANTVTSSPPAVLRIKSVELYAGSQLLTNGTYAFATAPLLTVRSAFPSGSVYYTLDGSTPSFTSTLYSGPFAVTNNATVRAIGYSADFSQSEEADAVNIVIESMHTLAAASSGGGWVTLAGGTPPPTDALSLWRAEGNTLDSAGTNNGTAEGSLAYAAGQVGQAFSLNGTDADVSIPQTSTLDVGSSNGLTVTTWFKPTSMSTPASLVEWFDPSFSLSHFEGVTLTINIPPSDGGTGSGCVVGNLQDTSGNSHLVTTPAGAFTAGSFHHTALTYDKTTGLAALYLNGNLVTQTNLGIFTPETRASNFHVVLGGVHFPVSGHIAEHFSGLMDETAIYGRALTSQEISGIYVAGGGFATNSPSGRYFSGDTVAVTAVAAPGWQFLHWLGDASGTETNIQVTMERDKSIYAIFGTTLSTTVAGAGQVVLNPPGGLYEYGETVRLTGVPNAGSFFGAWGNAASGSTNPLYVTITSPTQTVSSIFETVSSGQAALTVSITGLGQVEKNPQGNVFSTGQSVTLTAVPDDGQTFVSWSGDASGTNNPLNVTMDQSKYITANFSGAPSFRLKSQEGEGLGSAGFRFELAGPPGAVYRLFSSTDFVSWQSMGYVTNNSGEVQILDPNTSGSPRKFYRIAP